MHDLYLVTVPKTRRQFCCGITVKDDVVVHAAPIMGWAIGKNLGKVIRWVEKHGGWIERCKDL